MSRNGNAPTGSSRINHRPAPPLPVNWHLWQRFCVFMLHVPPHAFSLSYDKRYEVAASEQSLCCSDTSRAAIGVDRLVVPPRRLPGPTQPASSASQLRLRGCVTWFSVLAESTKT
jgi:hypothetical protein